MTYAIDMKNILLENLYPHLVVLTPEPQHKSDLLKAISLAGVPCQGASFKLENGTRVTIANIESEIPTGEYHLAYHNWQMKKGFSKSQLVQVKKWEKNSKQIVNLFE